tara:strand:+ start:845 stop:1771 length:927 start_codon:yes stop_codon:yes gene_type:complete
MNTLQLGNTDLYLPAYSIGTATFGKVYGKINEQNIALIVKTAIKNGLNYFDTSPYYGNKLSELNLGKALNNIPRDKYIISTKVGRYGDEIFDFTETTICSSLKSSLKRLNIDYVDILYAHDVEYGDIDTILNETLPALQKLKDAGLVRYIGFSCYPLDLIKKIIEKSTVNIDVVLSYGHYCLINDTLIDTIVPYLKDKQIGLVNASPLCMGLLTNSAPPEWHPASPGMLDTIDYIAHRLQTRFRVNITNIALNFPLKNSDIVTTLVGIRTMEDLNSLLKICQENSNYNEDIYEFIYNLLGKYNNYELE